MTTDTQILECLVRWKGNIKFISELLHMRRKNLYERVERLQREGLALPLAAYRKPAPGVVFLVRGKNMTRTERDMSRHTEVAPAPMARGGSAVRKVSNAPVTRPHEGSNVPSMQTGEEPALPIRTVQPRPRTLRITDENLALLRLVRRRLEAAFGVETDENLLLNQILEETTERWGQEKEALAPSARQERAAKAPEGKREKR